MIIMTIVSVLVACVFVIVQLGIDVVTGVDRRFYEYLAILYGIAAGIPFVYTLLNLIGAACHHLFTRLKGAFIHQFG